MANGYIPAAVERGCDPCSQVKLEQKAFLGGVLGIDINGELQPISEDGIVDLSFVMDETEAAAEQATASAATAAESAQTASEAATSAQSSETAAQSAANAAEAAKDDAEDAAMSANSSKNTADSYATAAQTAAAAAQIADGNAERSAESAIAAAAQAASSAGNALSSANDAYTSASTAQAAADAAQTAQAAAEASEATASTAATTATQAKEAAQTAQTAAETAQAAAAQSATAASGSATAAAGSETQAAASATAADASATAAAQSAATLTLDATLTSATQAAQAKAVGDELANLRIKKETSGNGEVFVLSDVDVTDVEVTGEATQLTVRNTQLFEGKYGGQSATTYGVTITKNDDDSYTINGTATSSPWYYLNQSSRTGSDNLLNFNGTYSLECEIISGSLEKVSGSGSTYLALGVKPSGSNIMPFVVSITANNIGKNKHLVENKQIEVNDSVIALHITNGVKYTNLRIRIMMNKGEKILPWCKYKAPTVIADFSSDISSIANAYIPDLWLYTNDDSNIAVTYLENPKAYIDSEVARLEEEIDSMSAQNHYNVLTKYNDRVDALTQLFNNTNLFLIYTDIHGDGINMARIAEWFTKNKPVYVSDCLFLGDAVDDQATDSLESLEAVPLWGNTLKVIGNHDVLVNTTIPGITAVECYNKYIAPHVSAWNVVQPSNASTDGKCYYYKDYASSIRLIVLDTYFYTEAQHTWFVSTLADARTNGLAVIVAEHEDICTPAEKQPLNSEYPFATKQGGYTGLQYRTYGNGGDYQTKRAAVDEFIGNGGTFICWLAGHQHADMTGTYDGANGKQLSIILSNASMSMTSTIRIRNYSQDCFTYLGINTDNHYIYLLRIGEAVDKWYHQNLFLCYDYVNHTVIEHH